MKKLFALLLAMAMVLSMAACGNSAPAATEAPATEAPVVEAPATEAPAAAGSVYYLNFKPEADAAWQELAAQYTAETGVEVKVVTAASGTYSDTLTSNISDITIYNIGNLQGLADWDEYALDLTDTALAGELSTNDFNLYNGNGELKAMGYCYESYGIIVNVDLLAEAGYSVADITNFESLKAVADDIHARSAELGFDAFSAAGLDSSSSWRFSGHLANVPLYYEFEANNITEQPATLTGEYLDNFRNIWDLYITDSAADPASLSTSTGDESKAQFVEGKAVFFQNGSWEYNSLANDNGMNVQMIPIYCGVEGEEKAGLCSGTENCWAVNAQASEEDIKASLDFLYWVVTSEAGTTMMSQQFGAIPFKAAPAVTNGFILNGDALLENGCYSVTWAFNDTPNVDSYRATLVTALAAYSANPTDDNWANVVSAYVDGWAIEYAVVHG